MCPSQLLNTTSDENQSTPNERSPVGNSDRTTPTRQTESWRMHCPRTPQPKKSQLSHVEKSHALAPRTPAPPKQHKQDFQLPNRYGMYPAELQQQKEKILKIGSERREVLKRYGL